MVQNISSTHHPSQAIPHSAIALSTPHSIIPPPHAILQSSLYIIHSSDNIHSHHHIIFPNNINPTQAIPHPAHYHMVPPSQSHISTSLYHHPHSRRSILTKQFLHKNNDGSSLYTTNNNTNFSGIPLRLSHN